MMKRDDIAYLGEILGQVGQIKLKIAQSDSKNDRLLSLEELFTGLLSIA